MIHKEAMVGRAVKQVLIATVLSGALAGLTGCMSMAPKVEPTATAKPRPKVVRMTTAPKIVKRKKITAKRLVKPAEETAPVVVPPLGGGGGSGGRSGGGGWG